MCGHLQPALPIWQPWLTCSCVIKLLGADAVSRTSLPPSAPQQLPYAHIRILKLPDGSDWLLGR